MKLTKLVIQNFLSVQNATLYLADKGLVSIEGVNEDKTGSDSNGCGKSSIINAILWCNYGSYGKAGSSDDVVNSSIGKDCFVRCEWREGSNVYNITRYRKDRKYNNSIRVELNGKDITKAGAQAVQQQINEILGADETVFRASCFAQQENPLDIPAMTDSKLKALLEELLPLDDLSPLHKKATENVTTQEALVKKLNSEIDLKTWQIEHCKKELKLNLDLRLKWQEDEDNKVGELDKQIKLKNIARGIALGMSNKGNIEKEIEDFKFRIDAIGYSDYIMASYKHNEAEKHVDALKHQLANPVNTCKECGQEVEDLEKVKSRIQDKLDRAESDRDILRDKAKVASYNHTQKETLKRQLEANEQLLLEAERNKEAADRLAAEISLLEAQKAPSGSNPYTPTVTRLRSDLKAAITKQDDFKKQLTEAEQHLEILKAVQLTYSPKGLRYHVLEKVAPKLTAGTNKYLTTLTDGAIQAVWSTVTRTASGDYKEKFSIEARMEGRSNFGLLSGGEKRKVRLACFFALQDLIASQATKNIELWAGDEIDVALDPAGMERLMGILAEKTKTKSTILVISHNEMREWIPNYATVTRKDGVSTITGYLNNEH
jgi:DNA repair exonuclease SbcCD ATPase subunit